jgi:hypothetical protein
LISSSTGSCFAIEASSLAYRISLAYVFEKLVKL